MPTLYPGGDDTFNPPSDPAATPLSSPGDGPRSHTQEHRDLGDAVEAIQKNAALRTHDHSGSGARSTPKLIQANTHEGADTDSSHNALHHTLGRGSNQAAPGDHTHDGVDSLQLTINDIQYLASTLANRPETGVVEAILGPGLKIRATFRATTTDSQGRAWVAHGLGRTPIVALAGIRTNNIGFTANVAPGTLNSENLQIQINSNVGPWVGRAVLVDVVVVG